MRDTTAAALEALIWARSVSTSKGKIDKMIREIEAVIAEHYPVGMLLPRIRLDG